jgi:hypothetical protein
MLLQTNSYIVPKDKRSEHHRLMRRFRQALARIGCDHFEVYEQVGPSWGPVKGGGRFVQILRFRDRKHQMMIQQAEKSDPAIQQVIAEFCELVNLPYQQEKGLFALGYYIGVVTTEPGGVWRDAAKQGEETAAAAAPAEFSGRSDEQQEIPPAAAVHERVPLEQEQEPQPEHQGNGPNSETDH